MAAILSFLREARRELSAHLDAVQAHDRSVVEARVERPRVSSMSREEFDVARKG